MDPSPLYSKLLSLSEAMARPKDLAHILAIRTPEAIHAWGHNYLVSRNPKLADKMDNKTFEAHLCSTGPYLDSQDVKVHSIIVDEHQRTSAVRMSYFLTPVGSDETVEQDLVWTLKFTDELDVDRVLIKESVEFIDGAASARLGTVIRKIHGEVREDVRGGITLKEEGHVLPPPSTVKPQNLDFSKHTPMI